MPEKQVIDPKQATAVASGKPSPEGPKPQQSQTPQASERVFRFVKLQVPAEVIELRDGTKISFRIPQTQHNGFAPVGLFETPDEKVARELLAISKQGGHFIVPVED
jgi:hypothetical protein